MPYMKTDLKTENSLGKSIPDDPRKRAKYMAIIEAALEAFSEYGYHDCPVSKIARKANVADGTIYLYFANKEEVLISVFQEKINRLITDIEKLTKDCTDSWGKIEILVRYHMGALGNDRVLANFLQIQLRQSSANIRRGIALPLKKFYLLIENFVVEGQKEGVIDSFINANIARKLIFGTIDEVISCWVLSRRQYDVTERIDDVIYILRRALIVDAAA